MTARDPINQNISMDPNRQPASRTKKLLHILHLEDDPSDAELVKLVFDSEGIAVDILRVETRLEFEAALGRGGFDLIFSDYSIPGFDGVSALEMANTTCPEVPFIFISGRMGEELAIETLKSGATDYILKEGVRRLVPAVRRALKDSEERYERRQTVDALKGAYAALIQANVELKEEIARREQTEKELVKVERALRTLGRSNAAIVHAAGERAFAEEICKIIVGEGKYLMAWVGYPQDDAEKNVKPYAYAGRDDGYLDVIKVTWGDDQWGRGPTGSAIRTGKVCIKNNRLSDPFFAPWREEAQKRGFVSAIGLPLSSNDRCFGSLTIYASQTDIFIDKECLLLTELANNVAFAITSLRLREKNRLAEQEIRVSRERLHNLAAHLQRIREEERTAIARDIHDEFGQMLTALKLNLSRSAKDSAELYPELSLKLKKDIDMVDAVIKSVKRLCTELRPSMLDFLGLGPAIEWQAEEFGKRSGIQCNVSLDPEDIEINPDMSIALFRILQESLTNVMRHADATKVEVTLRHEDDSINLEIADNGIGMTEKQLEKTDSFGILGMRERVYPWKGSVGIVSSPSKGTRILVSIPMVD